MKKIKGIILISSPLWLLLVIQSPAVLIQLAKGRTLEQIRTPIENFMSYLFFIESSVSSRGYVDREILYSSVGTWLRISFWIVAVFLAAIGVRLILKSKAPTKNTV